MGCPPFLFRAMPFGNATLPYPSCVAKGRERQKEEDAPCVWGILFDDVCKLGLFVKFLLAQVLDIDSFLSAFPIDNGRFGKFLTFAKLFHNTSFFEFSFELFECSFNVFTFFNRNYDHC